MNEKHGKCPRCDSDKRQHTDTVDAFPSDELTPPQTQNKEWVCLECSLSYCEWTKLVESWKATEGQ